MVQSNELRIGNYVSSMVNHRPLIKVLQLFGDSFQGDFGNGSRGGIMYENTEGIPLTEEWLIKLGFTIHSDYSYRNYALPNHFMLSVWLGDGQPGGFEKPGAVYWSDSFAEIKYVHVLQNLFFALYREELTISEPTKQ